MSFEDDDFNEKLFLEDSRPSTSDQQQMKKQQGPSSGSGSIDRVSSRDDLLKRNLEGEVEQLQLLVGDLSRRLQNAHHTIESHKQNATKAAHSVETLRNKLDSVSNMFRMEQHKTEAAERKKRKEQEARKYDAIKKKQEQLHEEYRFAVIDHQASGHIREPSKIGKMKVKLEEIEAQADSQRLLLQHFGKLEELVEELSTAAQSGNLTLCHTLLQNGVNPNHLDLTGFLPLHYACARGHADVARLLLEYGSDCTAYLTGYSPIELSARSGSLQVIEHLLHFGADIEETGAGKRPPLVSAVASMQLECVKVLLDRGADINARDVRGNTALHEAAKLKEPVDMIFMLLRRGAETQIRNFDEKTPMEVAMATINVPALEAFGGRIAPGSGDGSEEESVFADQVSLSVSAATKDDVAMGKTIRGRGGGRGRGRGRGGVSRKSEEQEGKMMQSSVVSFSMSGIVEDGDSVNTNIIHGESLVSALSS